MCSTFRTNFPVRNRSQQKQKAIQVMANFVIICSLAQRKCPMQIGYIGTHLFLRPLMHRVYIISKIFQLETVDLCSIFFSTPFISNLCSCKRPLKFGFKSFKIDNFIFIFHLFQFFCSSLCARSNFVTDC